MLGFQRKRLGFLVFVVIVMIAAVLGIAPKSSTAQVVPQPIFVQPTVTVSQLQGPWVITLIDNTGCGWSSSYITVTFNAAGVGTGLNRSHTSGCGDPVGYEPLRIASLSPNGSGIMDGTCIGCGGWIFHIQVSTDVREFNIVDVSPSNPGNYLEGTAIRQ